MKTTLDSGMRRHPNLIRKFPSYRLWRKYTRNREIFEALNRAYYDACIIGTKREKQTYARLALKHQQLAQRYLTLALYRDELWNTDKYGKANP